MHIRDLNGKTVCILGFGKEGRSTLAALRKYAPTAEVTIADQAKKEDGRRKTEETNVRWQTGGDYLHNLDRFDVIIKSPGIPPSSQLTAHSSQLTSATQIFLDSIADSGATVIGVTGSKGKSTTASLIHHILHAAGKDAHLVGNIGKPVLDYLERAKPNTFFVQEMSSAQLMDLTTSPHTAVITSFFPEHLDYHGSVDAYQEAKRHITRFQGAADAVFFNRHSKGAQAIAEESPGKRTPFGPEDAPLRIEETHLIGEHNLGNIAGAFAVAMHVGIDRATALDAIATFTPLPHRLQSLGIHHGIEWIDDAISTTPESTIAALDALGDRVATVILGGTDRGLDFTSLGKRIAHSPVRTVILFPGSGPRIRKAIEEAMPPPPLPARTEHPSPHGGGAGGEGAQEICFFDAPSMADAVAHAKQHTPQGMICLLSTASPSYNMFKNFEEKGEVFQREISVL
ncbi:MAG: UDP-N-acetylmuramoyl-L-alanyl-D-glutamate synthetase [Candidatus Peregrinibacteria bacterium Gr01-1014_25]|nr:MAG: UDP-N-acetylmuramoyl-L-alanyl-D-glutamate synthetase [Candidatus Peregrinibacteria bacterium Gr01-1014_25]